MLRVIPQYEACQSFSHIFEECWKGLEVECSILDSANESFKTSPSTIFIQEDSDWFAINFGPMQQPPPQHIILELKSIQANLILRKSKLGHCVS